MDGGRNDGTYLDPIFLSAATCTFVVSGSLNIFTAVACSTERMIWTLPSQLTRWIGGGPAAGLDDASTDESLPARDGLVRGEGGCELLIDFGSFLVRSLRG